MRRQHTGRGTGTGVIGPDWSRAHRAAASGTHTAGCSIRHQGSTTGPIDPATGVRSSTANPAHYTGSCAVTQLPADQTPEAGEETVPTTVYIVALDWDAAPATRVGDIVTVTGAGPNGDPTLTGVHLRVDSIARDSLAWERVLRCSENQS